MRRIYNSPRPRCPSCDRGKPDRLQPTDPRAEGTQQSQCDLRVMHEVGVAGPKGHGQAPEPSGALPDPQAPPEYSLAPLAGLAKRAAATTRGQDEVHQNPAADASAYKRQSKPSPSRQVADEDPRHQRSPREAPSRASSRALASPRFATTRVPCNCRNCRVTVLSDRRWTFGSSARWRCSQTDER